MFETRCMQQGYILRITQHRWTDYHKPYVMDQNGVPNGIRTHVTAVKGRCPRPLDDRDSQIRLKYIISGDECQEFF